MASTLASLMVRAGLLSDGQGRAAFEHAAESGRSVIEAVLELGLADEDSLVAFAQSRLLIPRVRDVVLGRVAATTWGLIPGELAWKTLAMPVSQDDAGNLTIALADPTDSEAVDALARHTRAYVIRAVAPLSALRTMLTARYGAREALDPAATQAAMRLPPAPSRIIPGRGPTLAGAEALDETASGAAHPATGIAMRASGWSAPVAPSAAPAPGLLGQRPLARTPGGADYDPRKSRLHHVSPEDSAALSGAVRAVAPGSLDQTERPASNPAYGAVQGYGSPFELQSRTPSAALDPFATEAGSHGGTAPATSAGAAPHSASLPSHQAARPPSQPQIASGPLIELPRGPRPPASTSGGPSHNFPDPRAMEQSGSEKRIISVTPPRTPARTPGGPRGHVWNPPLTGPSAEPVPLSPEAFQIVLPQIEAAASRDDVVRVVLDFFGAGFSRVILFVNSRQELRGHDCRGPDLLVEAVRQVRIPSSGPSLFERCITGKTPYFGRMTTATEIDNAFAQALGGVSGNVLLLPLTLGDRVPLVLFAHGTRHAVDPVSVHDLTLIVGSVLQRLVLQAKRS